MTTLLAAGPFDSPWVVVVFLLVTAIANWLSNRRQGQRPAAPSGTGPPTPGAAEPPAEFDLETTLRRLMGEEPAPEAPAPPLPRTSRAEPQPAGTRLETAPTGSTEPHPPPLSPPLIAAVPADTSATSADDVQEPAAHRPVCGDEPWHHPPTTVAFERGYRRPRSRAASSTWRKPREARRAFVASLVFGPPKSLEP